MITGFHHFAFFCSSDKSVEFYKKLGFNEHFRSIRAYDTVVLLEGFGTEIEMFIDPTHPNRAVSPENLGLRHIALKVDDVEKTLSSLCIEFRDEFVQDDADQKGIKRSEIMKDWVGIKFCYIYDPDCLPIELHE